MSTAEIRALMEAIAVTSLAGEAALEVFGDPDPRDGAQGDRASALEAARFLDAEAPLATAETLAIVARLYTRALATARQHRAPIARFAETLRANDDRLAGGHVTVALDAAFGGWPTPLFDAQSESRVLTRKRALFEAAVRDADSVGERIVLMRHCESAVWAGLSLAEYRQALAGSLAPLKGARA